MDFFKSVFSEDPDPSDLQKDSTSSLSQSPKNQAPNSNSDQETPTFNETDSSPNTNSESSSSSGGGGGVWDFGGLIKTLASKSETVIQTYRRDLEEFGSGLKKETAIIREVASRAVKELPASIEVGASVAQDSIESVGNVIDEFGSSVWRGTSEIISNSKESILSPNNNKIENSSDSSEYFRNSKRYSRFEMQVHAIQCDKNTYCEELDDLDDFGKWKLGFVLEEKNEEIENLLEENVVMEEVFAKLVPSVVDFETFWSRYFYRVYKLKQVEDARANLVKRAISGEEEDLSWDVDDDDNENGYEAKINEEKKETAEPVIEKQHIEDTDVGSSDVVNRETNDETTVVESSILDNVSNKKVQLEDKVNRTEMDNEEVKTKSDEKFLPAGVKNYDDSSVGSHLPVVASQLAVPEEEDLGWDEIDDLGSNDDKKVTAAGSPNRADLRKRLSTVDDEEDLSWDIEDDDEPVKH
ncbi:Bsd domain-containing protein [Thalictrum thalictroides]|uniref:Bsd domain-containing protein n=1 Tax=Thalictrum thalictroides TaxID=46969 RepID=A0A7J6W9K0_THATH|nr:Bsd domain-containing protein [Thalictrum thalictroides]